MVAHFRSIALLGVLTLAGSALFAQEPSPDARRAEASRAELQALLQTRGSKLSEDSRRVIQKRLEEGDFEPGDRIRLIVVDEPTLTDTFTVKPNRMLQLPNIPDVALRGVLRSELDTFLTRKIAQSLRNPQVTATALVRLAVLGAVNKPGFYTVPASTLISDVVMSAGGPAGNADIARAVVRRGAEPVVDQKQMRQAFADGASVDQLNLHSGDEFVVGEKSSGIKGALQTAGLISGIIIGIAALSRI
ncbi:MAG: polysaccharide biosynthesis/export family protein [Gammaproteobacteria bacterium]